MNMISRSLISSHSSAVRGVINMQGDVTDDVSTAGCLTKNITPVDKSFALIVRQ